MTELTTRAEAVLSGARHYFTGKPCKRGHIAMRRVSKAMCVECEKEHNKGYHSRNRDELVRKMADYNGSNRDKINDSVRQAYRKNPEATRLKTLKRRERTRMAVPVWFGELDEFAMSEAYDLASTRSLETGFRWEVDHLIPLRCKLACGLHVAGNIQVIPESVNRSKRNRMVLTRPLEWLAT